MGHKDAIDLLNSLPWLHSFYYNGSSADLAHDDGFSLFCGGERFELKRLHLFIYAVFNSWHANVFIQQHIQQNTNHTSKQ